MEKETTESESTTEKEEGVELLDGGRIEGEDFVFDINSLGVENKQPLNCIPITLYQTKESFPTGKIVTVSFDFICYVVKSKMIRVIHRLLPLRTIIQDYHTAPIRDISFHSDEKNYLIAASEDGKLIIYNLQVDKQKTKIDSFIIFQLKNPFENEFCISVIWHSTEENIFATATNKNRVLLWDIETEDVDNDDFTDELSFPDSVNYISFELRGTFVIICHGSHCDFWNYQSLTLVHSFQPFEDQSVHGVACIGLSGDFNHDSDDFVQDVVITTSEFNTTVKLWNSSDWSCLQTISFISSKGDAINNLFEYNSDFNFLLFANTKTSTTCVLHLNSFDRECEENPELIRINWLVQFATKMPVLSQTSVNHQLTKRKTSEELFQIYCVLTKAIEFYSIHFDSVYPLALGGNKSDYDLLKSSKKPQTIKSNNNNNNNKKKNTTSEDFERLSKQMIEEQSNLAKAAEIELKNLKKIEEKKNNNNNSTPDIFHLGNTQPNVNNNPENTNILLTPSKKEKNTNSKSLQKENSPELSDNDNKQNDYLLSRIDRLMQQHTDRLYNRLEKERLEREKQEKENLAKQISDYLEKSLETKIQEIFDENTKVIASSIIQPLQESFKRLLLQGFAPKLENTVKSTLDKALEQQFKSIIANQLQPIDEIVHHHIKQVLLPGFEKSCGAMFQQLHSAFMGGLSELFSNGSFISSINSNSGMNGSGVMELKQVVDSLTQVSKTMTESIIETQSKLMREYINLAKDLHNNPPKDPQNNSNNDPLFQVKDLIQKSDLSGAMNTALTSQDLSILTWFCKTVDPKEIFGLNPMPLTQFELLSLIQQLSFDLSLDTLLKLNWLKESIVFLDPENLQIKPYAQEILQNVLSNLQINFPNFADNSNPCCSQFKLLLHVVTNLIND